MKIKDVLGCDVALKHDVERVTIIAGLAAIFGLGDVNLYASVVIKTVNEALNIIAKASGVDASNNDIVVELCVAGNIELGLG